MSSIDPVIVIVGPTASGKTDLAQLIALSVDGEVVSADSMQVYRGMDIGTGKLPFKQRLVAHHGFDLVVPGEPYSAALFQTYARRCFKDISSRGKRALMCGGTGFYVRAAIDDYVFPEGEQVGNPIRDRYNAIARIEGAESLWRLLNERDPRSAEIIPPRDVKRVVRAFELLESGSSYASQKEKLASIPQLVPAVFIGLHVDPDLLRRRIDARVDSMFEMGLVEEVEGLLNAGFREGITAPQAIGYKEVVSALDGNITMDEARQKIKIATHRYAKRQRTWFRKEARIHWIDANEFDGNALADRALRIVRDFSC